MLYPHTRGLATRRLRVQLPVVSLSVNKQP